MEVLRERDREILSHRYGLDGEALTLEQCAEIMGVTRERIRQIQKRAEEQLTSSLRCNYSSCF